MIPQFFWSAVVITIVAACSSSNTPSSTTLDGSVIKPAMTSEEACSNYATRLCELYARCEPWNLEAIYGTIDNCKARHQLTCPYRFAADGSTLTIATLEACSSALATFSCDIYNSRFEFPSECQTQPGKLPDGAACGLDEQCQGMVCNKRTWRDVCGVCQQRVPLGGSCFSSTECVSDLWCPLGTCQPWVEEGGQCDYEERRCRGYLECVGVDTSNARTGSCQKPLGAGAACDVLDDLCDYSVGLTCIGATCHFQPFVDIGKMCGAFGGTMPVCRARATCDTGTGNSGTCIPAHPDGAPCASNTDCLPLAKCFNQICTIPDPTACH